VKDKLPKYCGNIVEIHKDNPNARRCSLRYNILSRETLNVLSEGDDDTSKASDTDKLIEYKHFQNNYIFNAENIEKICSCIQTVKRNLLHKNCWKR